MSEYRYGMRHRGFSPMCQPMDGLTDHREDPSGKYYDILSYNRMLTFEEVKEYELEPIGDGLKDLFTEELENLFVRYCDLYDSSGIDPERLNRSDIADAIENALAVIAESRKDLKDILVMAYKAGRAE